MTFSTELKLILFQMSVLKKDLLIRRKWEVT